jgi:quercetin dioxygenase-like cupin family protein
MRRRASGAIGVQALWTLDEAGETIALLEFQRIGGSMKRTFVALLLAGAAVWTATAFATPSQGQSSTILALGALQDNLAFNTGLTVQPTGVTWGTTTYTADQLPEFLMRLRRAGVTSLGEWLNLHPVVSARFGMTPVGLLNSPEVVTQQTTFAPGAASGWHSHPGYLTATVVSGQVVRYATDCSSQTFNAGQSFYETAAKAFIVKNVSTTDPAVLLVTFVVPGGTPTTGLRIDQPQPTTCSQ